MKPLIRKGEFVAQASLITDIIVMAQNFECIIESYNPFRKQLQLLTSSFFSISKNVHYIYLITSYACWRV